MIKRITAGIAAAGIAVTAFALPASAAARPVHVNWTARTCSAFAAWERKPSTVRLDTLAADSFHVPWKYLGDDVASLYVAVRGHGDRDLAVQYVYEDCNNGSGL
jgi:hypothetical protein